MKGILILGTLILYLSVSLSSQRKSDGRDLINKDELISDNAKNPTIEDIKESLKVKGIFEWDSRLLTDSEKKEAHALFDAVEIVMSSRARQPTIVQQTFSSLRMVERIADKMLRDGQISQSLMKQFKWDALKSRQKRDIKKSQRKYKKQKNSRSTKPMKNNLKKLGYKSKMSLMENN